MTLLISFTSGRFPRAVLEPPHRKLLRGLNWTRFSRWSPRLPLQTFNLYRIHSIIQQSLKLTTKNRHNFLHLF